MKQLHLYISCRFSLLILLALVSLGSTAEASQVPKLKISWDCGTCTQNPKVIPLILQAYADEARKNGRGISETDVAQVSIVDFRQRNPGMRVMFGIMAGKDRLGLTINYQGNTYTAADDSANVVQGMNHLCASAGIEAYRKLSTAVK